MKRKKSVDASMLNLPLNSERRVVSPNKQATRVAAAALVFLFLACTGLGVLAGLEVKTAADFDFHQVAEVQL